MERESRRRIAGGAIVVCLGLLLGDAFLVNQDLTEAGRLVLAGIAILSMLYWLATTEYFAARLPSIRFRGDRQSHSLTVRWQPSARGGTARLRRETLALVKDMQAHVQAAGPSAENIRRHQQAVREREAASEKEKDAVWDAYGLEVTAANEQERLENVAKFGGRTQAILEEYVRRGMLPQGDVPGMMFDLGSNLWLVPDVATRLETLARQL